MHATLLAQLILINFVRLNTNWWTAHITPFSALSNESEH